MHAYVLGMYEMGTVNQSLQSNAESTLAGCAIYIVTAFEQP